MSIVGTLNSVCYLTAIDACKNVPAA